MKIIDPGHEYGMRKLDVPKDHPDYYILPYVKREGPGYPGNVGHHAGVNMQEVLRAQIHRIKYLQQQDPDERNIEILRLWRYSLYLLEECAAERHNRFGFFLNYLGSNPEIIEDLPFCNVCGHIACNQHDKEN